MRYMCCEPIVRCPVDSSETACKSCVINRRSSIPGGEFLGHITAPTGRLGLLCRFPLVILQQAAQSFSTPHCSRVPSCLRLRRKQDPISFALMVALLVVMYDILLQRSPQRRFSKTGSASTDML